MVKGMTGKKLQVLFRGLIIVMTLPIIDRLPINWSMYCFDKIDAMHTKFLEDCQVIGLK